MSDFLVIGGGIAGVSAAARLAPLGKVTLLEREGQLGYHASGRSAALFEESYGKPSTTALTRASAQHMHDHDLLAPRGLLLLGRAGEDATFDADKSAMSLDEISLDEARQMVPILKQDLTRAAFHKDAWDIDTDRLIQGFARDITRHGGQIVGQADVTRIARTRLGWTAHTGKGELYGGRVLINAAGAWADDVALMARVPPIGLQPCRRSMGRIPAPLDHNVTDWPMFFGPGETWYAKPDAGALIVSPAEEDPMDAHDAFADDMVLAQGFARYEAYVEPTVNRLLSSWAGLRSFAPDRQLVLGPEPTEPTFIWCAAQGGYGMQTAPAAADLIADHVAGRAPQIGKTLAETLSVARLR